MISDKEKQLRESLQEKEYREALAVEHVNTTLAAQIRKLRESRIGNQSDLAKRLGKHQETICQWENPDYGKYSLTSLKALASAFDVALLVKFIPFSELVKDMVSLSEIRLSPPSFSEEQFSTTAGQGAAQIIKADANTLIPVEDILDGWSFPGVARANEPIKGAAIVGRDLTTAAC